MFGAAQPTVSTYLRKNGMNRSGSFSGKEEWDKEGFWAWASGVPKTEECQSAQETVEDEVSEAEAEEILDIIGEEVPDFDVYKNKAEVDAKILPMKAIPATGSMTFEGLTEDILKAVGGLLGGAKVLLSVKWDVVTD